MAPGPMDVWHRAGYWRDPDTEAAALSGRSNEEALKMG